MYDVSKGGYVSVLRQVKGIHFVPSVKEIVSLVFIDFKMILCTNTCRRIVWKVSDVNHKLRKVPIFKGLINKKTLFPEKSVKQTYI
jgi:hypothetical protein